MNDLRAGAWAESPEFSLPAETAPCSEADGACSALPAAGCEAGLGASSMNSGGSSSLPGSFLVLRYFSYASHRPCTLLPKATWLPWSSQRILLHSERTWPVEWLTSSVVAPPAMISRIFASLFLRKAPSPTESTSSRMSTSGSTRLAMENARRLFMPLESCLKGRSSNPRSSAKSMMES